PGAPGWAGDQLRLARRGAADALLATIRACAEAMAAARHEVLAPSYQALERAYVDREDVLARVMAGPSGNKPPQGTGSSPSRPPPNCVADTLPSTSSRSARPSPNRSPSPRAWS